jgi:hypothetical protein
MRIQNGCRYSHLPYVKYANFSFVLTITMFLGGDSEIEEAMDDLDEEEMAYRSKVPAR